MGETIKYEITDVTPDMARKWLDESNFNNRPLNQHRVSKIAHDIKNDKWVFDGTPIRFNGSDNLLDGQHRLHAIIKANRSVKTFVFKGLESISQNTIDTGKARNVSDVLHFNGYINTTSLSSAARLAVGYREFKGEMKAWDASKEANSISPQDILTEINKKSMLIKATQAVISLKYIRKMVGSGSPIFCYFLFATNSSQHIADAFFQKLENGDDLSASSPILKLRNEITLRDTRGARRGQRQSIYNIAMFIKAWNAWRSGENIDSVRWSPTEEYPKIIKENKKANG